MIMLMSLYCLLSEYFYHPDLCDELSQEDAASPFLPSSSNQTSVSASFYGYFSFLYKITFCSILITGNVQTLYPCQPIQFSANLCLSSSNFFVSSLHPKNKIRNGADTRLTEKKLVSEALFLPFLFSKYLQKIRADLTAMIMMMMKSCVVSKQIRCLIQGEQEITCSTGCIQVSLAFPITCVPFSNSQNYSSFLY